MQVWLSWPAPESLLSQSGAQTVNHVKLRRLPERSPSLHTEADGAAVPETFGPFRVLHQIGAGTLGPVFRAYDAERERLVAVKLFRLDVLPERAHQLVEEFERLIAAELGHPSLARPVAAGLAGVSPYLAVEYVNAESLDLALREYGPAPSQDAVRVITQLAAALDFAAAAQVVHGAMHPRDVLLSADDTRITGIGIARALERVGIAAPMRRPYSAPERVAGASWDRRADVFTLAALAHEVLWGRRIAGTGRHVAGSLGELPGARLTSLQDVFARALSEEVNERFETALEFVDALRSSFAFDSAAVPVAAPTAAGAAHTVEAEPRLPLEPSARVPVLDAAAPLPVAAPHVDVETVDRPAPKAPDLDLRTEPPRFHDVEPAATTPPESVAPVVPPAIVERPRVGEPVALAPARQRSIFWPVAAALVIGAALGFSGGLQFMSRDRLGGATTEGTPLPVAASEAPKATAAAAPRDATDVPVDAPRVVAAQEEPASPTPPQPDRRPTPRTPAQTTTARSRQPERTAAAPSGTVGRFVGGLSVDSRPTGARVFLDGRLIGTTPVALPSVAAGEHAIRLEREGYRRWSSSVRIVAAEQNRVTASLER